MFDNFFNQIDKELGPLNPDWFEELTAKAFRDEWRPKSSKVEEEETVKVSATSALASHSTPKIFKQPHFQSPASILNEESPYEVVNGDSSAFPWTDSSPCLFGSESDKDSQRFDRSCEKPRDYFGLLDTPKRSLAHSAKQISESLGAQINPDLSWTSSFNTPSSLAPTVILPETEEHAPSASGLKDKEATFVRKLFPSLSKGSASNATLSDTSLKQEVIAESETIQSDDLGEKPVCSPNTSLDTSGLWKQKVPSAIEDGDVRNTVQNVLDGAEDVLSIFFSNSTATLRRSKTKERIRRRITDSSKDVKSVVLTSESEEILKDDVETKRPCKNKDDTQWTPLSFSESTLNIDCSDVSLINNHNNVASSEINGCTVFNCIAENSQTFPQTVRLKSYPEGTQCQKPLLDKSPAFMLSRKPRKFVYQVPSSDLSKTVIGHKETQPVCLDQTLKENPSVEEVSSDLNKSRVASENAINNHKQPQDFKQLSTEIHDPDLGLDMTQLSKAFAEDFTQEIMPGARLDVAVKSDQNGQVQHKAELEEKNEDGSQNDISNLADISVNSPNKSTVMLTTFEISHDSGCPTTFSDLDSTTTSCADIKEFFPSSKMANKAISIPNKTIMKAKASLDKAAGDVLINTLNGTTLKHQTIETLCKSVSGSTNANRSPIEQSIFPNHASRLRVSDAPKSDSSKSFKINISSCSSPQSNESDYKTGLKRNITVSNVGFLTETLLKEELGRGSDSSKCIHQKLDFKRIAERQTMFNINSAHNPTAVDSSREDDEENGTLTASQKADVTELCNLLEEANSQHEFTQSKPANHFSDNHTSEKEWDPDILYGIDFDDSFNCDVKGKHPIKTDSSSVNASDHIIVDASKLPCTMSKETQNGIVPLSVAEDGSLVDGIKSIQSHFSDNTPVHFFGFKTAKGEAISISEKSLNNARHVFEEDDQKAVCIKEVKVDIGLIKPEHVETEPTFNTFDSMSTENKTYLQIKQDVNFSSVNVNAACKERNKQVIENEGTEQNCLGEKTDVFCVDSNSHFGFSTASGAKLKVPEKALLQARKLLDVDSLEESQTHKLTLHASGNHNGSMSTTSLKKTKAVSWSNTSIKISEPYLVTKISNGEDRLCFNSEKVFQEQKSSSDPKEVFSKIFPTETFSLQSEEGYGFQTASGKGVSVSACTLKKAKDIFKDCDENIDLKMEGINDKLDVEIKQVNAFTPNCKRVTFSDVSFMEANTVLNDSDVTDDDLLLSSLVQQPPQKDLQSEFSKHPYELLPRNGNCGFSTASGKKVSISAGALQSSKDLLSDDGFSCADGSPKTKKVVDIQTDTSSIRKHKGFSTADGKKVAVSAAGLQRAKNLFRDCEEERLSFEDLQHQNFKGFSDVSKKPLTKIRMAFAGCSDISFSHEHETGDSSGNNIGFSTAGGRKVAVSATGLQRAKSLFKDCEEESLASGSHHHQVCQGFSTASGKDVTFSEKALSEVRAALAGCDDTSFHHEPENTSGNNIGFSTAGGKKVAISATGLQRAKSLFKDCEEESLASGSHQHQVCQGISTASGKDVTISEKALSEVRAAFAGCDDTSFHHEPENSSRNNIGFSTAGGKKVAVSATGLQRAKCLFKDCEEESLASGSLQHQVCQGFSTASGKDVTISKKALSEVRAALAGCDDTSFHHEPENTSGNNIGFSTAGGKKVAISATGLQRAKSLFKDCEEESLASGSHHHQVCQGFSTASGKDVTISEKALSEVRAAFAGCDDTSFHHEPENSSRNNIGFSTAGGKKVAVSATGLQRAKCLFKDCEEESLASGSLQHQVCQGISTASGKDVTVSEKALSEVRAAFASCDDTSFHHEPENTSGNNIGFSTAGGKKVAISANAVQRAKCLFKDCEEENLSYEEVPPQTKSSHKSSEDMVDGNLKFEQLNKKKYGFSTAGGKGVSVSEVALEEASKLFRDCDAQVTVTDSQLLQSDSSECRPQHKDRQTKTTLRPLPSKATQNEHAKLDLHSLDFYSCTDTQQKYFEQEAMACTKALLADDDLNESGSLAMTEDQKYPFVHELQAQGSFGHKRRKRPFDARNIAGQPPLKRQLLSEFDRTLDTKTSGLTPLKSCPNGTLRDRRVFSYNVHLKSNVTGPDWHPVDQKSDDLEQPCSTVSIQNRFNSDPKGGVFVPPFQKGMKTGTSVCQDVSEVSTGFIPPFKKENKETTEHSNQIDQTSISHNDSVARYCDRKNQHEGSDPKPTTSVESIPLKIMDSEEKDTEACWETLNLARDMQDMRLRKKKRQTIRPLSGSLYLAKTSGVPRIGLRDAVGRKCPGQYTQEELYQHGVHHKVSLIKSENAESFRFDCNDFFKCEVLMESGAVQLADGGWLVPDNKGSVGKDEFYRALCDTPGVDPKLISDTWVFNHYRWIVWKRASMERTFPDLMGNLCLTPEQVLLQLKFRYDVEVDHSQRSALRRIMERDDTPAKTLVLCVCGVAQTGQHPEKPVKDDKTPNAKMETCVVWLTDGWYSIKGQLDIPLSAMLNKGRLQIGDKIVTSGAELVGSQEACPPLEAPESLMLKISANSTRRARWDTKLGYYRDPRPISFPLSSLFTAGGVVSCVNIVVLRSYPTQWMEKKPNGVFIFRNDRAEDREARKHSISKHKSMDLLISKIQTQFEKEMEGKKKSQGQRRTFSRHEIEALQDGEELYEAMERDPAVETHLSASQMDAVSKYRCCLEEKRQAELQERVQKAVMEAQEAEGGCPNRDVTPVWKLSITDAKDLQSNCVYTLNIWRPSQDLYGLLREGHRYRAYHLATSEGKKRSGIAHIQFTATKKTLFQDVEVSPEWLHQHFRARECVSFKELQNPQFSSPCGEVDIVGCIVSIDGKQGRCPLLHLVDENFDLVSVRTYSSLEQLAVEELVKLRALVALSNLQARPYSGPVPSLYAGEQAVFSVNPKESHLQEAMTRLKTFVQTCQHFFSIAEEKVSDVVPSGVLSSFQSPRTPCVQSNPKINGRVTPQQKSVIFSPFTPLNRRTPASACNSEGKDPKCLKRRRGLDYLSRIPSPPPLTPLQKTASPCVNRTFNPPRRSVTPKPPQNELPRASCPPPGEEKWVHDEELAMIDTQALLEG